MCSHQSGNACTDNDSQLTFAVLFDVFIRLFDADGHIQRALTRFAYFGIGHEGLDAVEAANTATDLFRMSFFDLLDPVGVADEGSCGTHEVLRAVGDLFLRLLRRTDEVRGDDRNAYGLLDCLRQIRSPAGLKGCRFQPVVISIVACGSNVDGVDSQFFQTLGDTFSVFQSITFILEADAIIHLVGGESDDQRILSAAALPDALNDLSDKTHPVLKASAVFVGTLVGIGA